MKVFVCLVTVALASAMVTPPKSGNGQKRAFGFGNSDHFANQFGAGIGDQNPQDMMFPDFSHGFINSFDHQNGFDDHKASPNAPIFTGPKQNIEKQAQNNFDDGHLDNFFPSSVRDNKNVNNNDIVNKNAQNATKHQPIQFQHEQITHEPIKFEHDAIKRKPVRFEHPVHEQIKHEPIKFEHPVHEQITHQPINFDHEPIKHEPVKFEHPVHEKFTHEPIKFEHPVHEQFTHEPIKFEHPVHEQFTHAPIKFEHPVHEPIKHENIDFKVPSHGPIQHEDITFKVPVQGPIGHETVQFKHPVHEPAKIDFADHNLVQQQDFGTQKPLQESAVSKDSFDTTGFPDNTPGIPGTTEQDASDSNDDINTQNPSTTNTPITVGTTEAITTRNPFENTEEVTTPATTGQTGQTEVTVQPRTSYGLSNGINSQDRSAIHNGNGQNFGRPNTNNFAPQYQQGVQGQYQSGQQGQYQPAQAPTQGQYQPGQQGQYQPGQQGQYQPGQQGQYQPGQQGQYQPGQQGQYQQGSQGQYQPGQQGQYQQGSQGSQGQYQPGQQGQYQPGQQGQYQPGQAPIQGNQQGQYQQRAPASSHGQYHGNGGHFGYDDHKDDGIHLPSVKDLNQDIPTPVIYRPSIAPFLHPDDSTQAPVTVSNVNFVHPDPPKRFTHDSFAPQPHRFSGSNGFPGFSDRSFGKQASSGGFQSFQNQGCPAPNDPSLEYAPAPTTTGYPSSLIANELNSRPELNQLLNTTASVEQLPALPSGGRDTCSSTQTVLAKFTKYGGPCYVLPSDRTNFVTCQLTECNQCSNNGQGTRAMCLPQYEYVKVYAFCMSAPSSNKINRETLPLARYCGCKQVQCQL